MNPLRPSRIRTFGLSWIFALGAANGAHAIQTAGLDQVLAQTIHDSEEVPDVGVAVAIVDKGKVVYKGGFGLADRASGRKVDTSTTFVLGSMSKAFTTLAFKQLQKDGLVQLNTPIHSSYPSFGLPDPTAANAATAEDLMSHRSGLARHEVFWYQSALNRFELFDRLLSLTMPLDKSLVFRKAYQYNNLAYSAMAALLEKSSGKSWESLLQDRILTPLGMGVTTLDIASFAKSPDAARGYAGEDLLAYKDVDSIAGAAGVNSSVDDLSRWIRFHLAKGTLPSGKPLISKSDWEDLVTPRIETSAGSKVFYALGWRVDQYQSRRLVRHAGNMDGFLGTLNLFPDQGFGFVVLTNQNDTSVVGAVAQKIMELQYGTRDRAGSFTSRLAEEIAEERGILDRPAPFVQRKVARAVTVGTYHNPAYGAMQVAAASGGGLELRYGSRVWPIHPTTQTVTLDMGGRTQDFQIVPVKRAGKPGFEVSWDEKAKPFFFASKKGL